MVSEILLDHEQRQAVETPSTAVVVVAGAGAGKTEVVARRVERLLLESQAEAFRVLALSYTVKAADELAERFHARLGNLHRRVDTDTVHGFALSLLRKFGSRIGLPQELEVLTRDVDRFELLEEWLVDNGHVGLEDPPSDIFRILDLARAREEDAPYLHEWREALDAAGALDYPSMLERAMELLESSWARRHIQRLYRHVILDEAQNLTQAQYDFVMQLVGDPAETRVNVMLVGDDRQSIVRFAGADPTLIRRFEREYKAERIELNNNYRSAQAIVRVGQSVSKALGRPVPIPEVYAAKGVVKVSAFDDEQSEGRAVAEWAESLIADGLDPAILAPGEDRSVAPEEIAVLARSSGALRFVRTELEKRGIPSATASTEDDWVVTLAGRMAVEAAGFNNAPGHRSVQRRMESLLGLVPGSWAGPSASLQNAGRPELLSLFSATSPEELIGVARQLDVDDPDWPNDLDQLETALESFVNRTNVADRTLGSFRHHIARCQRGDSLDPGIRLLTIHKAQGREFKAVAVVGCNDGQIPDFRARSEEDLHSELRTFYVAVTRPSRALLLSRSLQRQTRIGQRPTTSSRFLAYVDSIANQ